MHTPLYGGIRDSIRSFACLLLLVSSVPGLAQGQLNTPFEDLNLVVRPPDAPQGHANGESRGLRLEGALDDQAELLYGSLFGGNGWDEAIDIDESPDGIICLTGYTNSVLPGLARYDGFDVLVGCFDAESKMPRFIDTFGGAGNEYSTGIRILGDHVIVAGNTDSENLAGTTAGFQPALAGQGDCFLASWNKTNGMLEGSTYFGSPANDGCNDLEVEGDMIFVAGTTFGILPGINGPLAGPRGESDAFLAGFSHDLSALNFSELLGSSGNDTGVALAVAPNPFAATSAWGAGPNGYDIFVAGTADASDFPVTDNAAQSGFGGSLDGFVASYAFDPLDNSLSMTYGSFLGGDEQDVPIDINFEYPNSHPSMPILAVIGWLQSGGLETQGRAFNDGTLDGFLQIQFDPTQPVIRRYVGSSSEYNLPLGSDISDAGSILIGGFADNTTTGTAFLKTTSRYGNTINTIFAGATGSGNTNMDFQAVIAKALWRIGYGKTFGFPRLTDDAFQDFLVDPPDLVLQKYGPPTFLHQLINLTTVPVIVGPSDRFPHPIVEPFSATPLIESPNGPFDIEINPGTLTSRVQMFDTEDNARLRYYLFGDPEIIEVPVPGIGHYWERGTPSDIPMVFFNRGTNLLHVRAIANGVDSPPIISIPGGEAADALIASGEYEAFGEGIDFVDPRRYFVVARLRFAAAEKSGDHHESVERYPLPYLTVFTQSEAAASNAAADIDVLIIGPEGEQRSLVAPVANEPDAAIPARMVLHAAYPNPFNPSTQITFDLEKPMDVTLSVYDVSGRRVRELLKGARQAGSHSIEWDARNDAGTDVASGRYIIRLEGGDQVVSTRVVLQR